VRIDRGERQVGDRGADEDERRAAERLRPPAADLEPLEEGVEAEEARS
jgi:hypothetical protein